MCKDLGGNTYQCDGNCPVQGNVWGSGLYTSDSNIFQAARHMGIVPGKFSKVDVPGCGAYIGTTINGITTKNYGVYGSSYFLIKVDSEEAKSSSKSDMRDIFREELHLQSMALMKMMKKDSILCVVCCDNERSRAVFPCGHLHYC